MPSTYSPDLRIELIANGEQSGTWGITTNTNLGTLIEDAIAGYVSVSITSANQALTANNGTADQARNMVINLTTTTTANFNVYVPPANKFYVIRNSSVYQATIFCSTVIGNTTAAGAGIAIPAGKETIVFSDGTNIVSAIDYAPSFALGTALPATSGGTGFASYAVGDILYANTTTSIAKLADVATGNALISGGVGVAPSYGKIGLTTHVSGTLPVANGGTGLTAGTSGGVLYYSAVGTLASSAALAASSIVLGGGAGVAPATTTTGTGVVTALGVNTGTAGAFVVNGGVLGTPSSGTVTNLTGTASININGTVGATTANTGAFTSVTSTSASGVLTRAAATQDGVELIGRAGGTTSLKVTLTPTTLSASRTLTLPDNSGTILTSGAVVTAPQGGTGQTSYAVGDLLFASTTTALSKLADVATGNALISGGVGVAPSYGKIGLTTHVSGTLPVANGGTGVTTSTGSGSVVLSTSPTLVTPALGTPSSGVVTNLTGTASININGTVGATTANTGAFTTLAASGDVNFTGTGAVQLPAGTTAQRPTPITADLRYNTSFGRLEVYNGSAWVGLGGATGGGGDNVFYENSQTVTASYTITSGDSAMSTGPITVNSSVTVTVPSGSRWVVL